MYLKKSHILIAVLCLAFCQNFGAFAQSKNDFLLQAISKIDNQNANTPVEKVYLQFDKPFYVAGDDMWFKAYVVTGAAHTLATKSKVLTVELTNGTKAKYVVKLLLENGTGHGNLILPDTLKPGAYQVCAYTNLMRNFSSAYFFKQNFLIENALSKNVVANATYSFLQSGSQTQTLATIHFASVRDSAYTNSHVSYKIFNDSQIITEGYGTTNADGNLKVAFKTADTIAGKGTIEAAIKVGKNTYSRAVNILPDTLKNSIQFFPESGYLVNGLPSTVGFKILAPDGLGSHSAGTIVDNNNEEVAQIETSHKGMGLFSFTPQAGHSYKAKIRQANGDYIFKDLPSARNKGFVMRVFSDTAEAAVSIYGNISEDTTKAMHLIVQNHGYICYAADIKIKGTKPVVIRIPLSHFPSGIAQATLFSAEGMPLNERIFFVNNKADQLNLQLSADKQVYHPRQKVNLSLTSTDASKDKTVGNFSASVINETALGVEEISSKSILSTLLLTSDLKGYIEEPEYYFNNITDQTRSDLDLLMLTQGYRNYNWETTKNSVSQTPAFKAEDGITIAGHLKNTNGKPVPMGKVRLLTKSGPPLILTAVSDDFGHFEFRNLIFNDSTKFVLQANTQKGKSNLVVTLDNDDAIINGSKDQNYKVFYEREIVSALHYTENLPTGNRILKEVVIRQKREPRLTNSANLNGPGQANFIFDGKKVRDMACPTLASCLAGRLPGIIFDENGIPRSIRNGNGIMMVIIDGAKMITKTDRSGKADPFTGINASDISSIEVLTDPSLAAIYGFEGGNGVLIINTLKGGEVLDEQKRAENVLAIMPKGLQVTKEFYLPDYEVKNDLSKPDFRSTVSWQPQLVTDTNGKITFSYFNTDAKGTYCVTVEGIDYAGKIGRLVYRYKVE